MTEQGRILVTGATGNVGGQVVSQLAETGAAVRAFVRDPDSAARPAGVEAVKGNLTEPETLEAALEGVDSVFLVWPFFAGEGNPSLAIDAIAGRAKRVVYLSSQGVGDDAKEPADPINALHAEVEGLIERSGLEWTFLRAAGLAANALGWAEEIRTSGVVREPHGTAARSPVHERDIAAVAVRALTEDGHGGRKYVLTGPEVLTKAEQVRVIGGAVGRPLRFEEVPAEEAREEWIAAGLPPAVADGIFAAHARFVEEPEPVTATVEDVIGAPARNFREWASDHAGDFQDAKTKASANG